MLSLFPSQPFSSESTLVRFSSPPFHWNCFCQNRKWRPSWLHPMANFLSHSSLTSQQHVTQLIVPSFLKHTLFLLSFHSHLLSWFSHYLTVSCLLCWICVLFRISKCWNTQSTTYAPLFFINTLSSGDVI